MGKPFRLSGMTSDERRRDYLAAMGLVDWQYRDDGPLAGMTRGEGGQQPEGSADTAEDVVVDKEPAEPEELPGDFSGPADVTVESTVQVPTDAPSQNRTRESEDLVPERKASGSALEGLDWNGLEAYLGRQDHRGASRPVFGVGARDADVLIVGEAPGANEDAQGVPFVGRAGKLLDRMLFAIGCSRDTNVYITNICKFRPPDNRDPTADEVAADWPILERQIDLMEPKLVVAVGRVAAQTLLDCQTPLGKLRGRLHRYPRRELDVLVTYHPAYLLRSPDQKNKAWADLKIIARHIGSWGA